MSQSFTSNQIYTQPAINGGRLSLVSGSPIADASAQGTLYWVPYKSSYIALYNGVRWLAINAGEKSLALTLTSGSVYDVFGYLSSGTLALETLVWTNTTTRATALTTQDGCYVKSGDATRRYLGTIYASGTNQCTDSTSTRGLWNVDNQVVRTAQASDSTSSWTYTSQTIRARNNNTTLGTGAFIVVTGLAVNTLRVYTGSAGVYNSGSSEGGHIFIGVDSTSVSSATMSTFSTAPAGSPASMGYAEYNAIPAIGAHTYQALECSGRTTGTTNWVGYNSSGGIFFANDTFGSIMVGQYPM